MSNKKDIMVVGAGLCGTLLAIRLAQRGYNVNLYEKRGDMRLTTMDSGRSINLALSDRGIKALSMVGLAESAEKLSIPMYGRMLHDNGGNTRLSRYSGRESDYINSISRPGLNALLLDKADTYPNLNVHFNHQCIDLDFDTQDVIFQDSQHRTVDHSADIIIGADGAGSAVRTSILRHGARFRFSFSQDFLKHSYKELSIPSGKSGNFLIEKNALHIWPRGAFMLIALPNLDSSFTVTLFLKTKGKSNSFEYLKNKDNIEPFFKEYFKDTYELMPDIFDDMEQNPVGALGTVRCSPWVVKESIFLIGDAAHAIVPFYGQGMNCAFEDVTVLDGLLDKHKGDWDKVLCDFSRDRKVDSDAIADLALDNFYEMRDQVADEDFTEKRAIEMQLEDQYKEYYSKYSLVTFREDLPYHIAKKVGRFQDHYLLELVHKNNNISIEKTMQAIKKVTMERFPEYDIYG